MLNNEHFRLYWHTRVGYLPDWYFSIVARIDFKIEDVSLELKW